MTQHPARQACSQCGAMFQPVKPWHVICMDCYILQVRAAVIERGELATGKRLQLQRAQNNPRQGRNTPAVIGE